jgi:hypothetical protein
VSDPVPDGQAVIATLVARCYRMIHSSYKGLAVDPALLPIQTELHLIIDQLKFLVCHYKTVLNNRQRKTYLFYDLEDLSDTPSIDIALVQRLHDQLREIEKGRVDRKFLDSTGAIVTGQTILNQLLSEAHEIVNGMLAFQEAADTSQLSELMVDLVFFFF